MSRAITAKKVVTHPYFAMICYLSLIIVLPRYAGLAATMVGCAGILSVYIAVLPEHFRSRNGSMMAASCLLATVWLATAVITALTLMGEIRN